MFKVLLPLLFFPSITFGALSAEIFPWGIIFSLYFMRKISPSMLTITVLMLLSCVYTAYTSAITGRTLETDIARSLGSYINVLFLFQALVALERSRIAEISRMSVWIFWALIVLGCIQTIGSAPLGNLIKLLVPRGEGSALIESGRGVTLLATEPARAGIELMLIYLIGRLAGDNRKTWILKDVFLVFFMAFFIKSASAVAFSLGALAIIYIRLKLSFITILSMIIFISIFSAFVFFVLPSLGGRAGDLAYVIGKTGFNYEALLFIANESGNRLLALYSFFVSGIINPFGYGVGSWPYSSMLALELAGLDYRDFRFFEVRGGGELIPFRGPGLASNLLLDLGIIGSLAIFLLFKNIIRRPLRSGRRARQAFMIFMYKVLFFGSPGNPIPVLFLVTTLVISMPQNSQSKRTLHLTTGDSNGKK